MNTPESSSGLRIARFWKTNASISMPVPAIAQAISDPRIPVATPNRAGSENTPAPTIPPTTIAVRVGRLILAALLVDSCVSTATPPPGTGIEAREAAAARIGAARQNFGRHRLRRRGSARWSARRCRR